MSPSSTRRTSSQRDGGDSTQPASRTDANLLLSKALLQGDVSFIFRDLLCGPLWVEGAPTPEGQRHPTASLYAEEYGVGQTADGRSQVVNRWPRHATLTSKDGSLRSLVAYYRSQGLSPWCFVPLSFVLPNFALSRSDPEGSPQWQTFAQSHRLVASGNEPRVEREQGAANLWLLKPTNGSGGEGISIASDLSEIQNAMWSAKASTQGFIAQKYLERPLLHDGRKFDLRVWAIVQSDTCGGGAGGGGGAATSTLGLRIYGYGEGYARTSSVPFALPTGSGGSDANPMFELVHLTNYCLQVQSDRCGTHEEGNCVSFDTISADCEQLGFCFRGQVLPQIYALMCDAVLASRRELLLGLREHGRRRTACALLGYDFMVTESGRPYLIECNANPLLAAQNPWHDRLVTRMVDDYVEIAADATFFLSDASADSAAKADGAGGGAYVAPVAPAGAAEPIDRPPLDGVHCKQMDGNGFRLLVGRPTGLHPSSMFAVSQVGSVMCLERSEAERQAAAAVDEPTPPVPALSPAAKAAAEGLTYLSKRWAGGGSVGGQSAGGGSVGGVGRGPRTATPPRFRLASGESSLVGALAAASERTHAVSASDRLRLDTLTSHEAATERRLAAVRYAAAHRAKASVSMPSSLQAISTPPPPTTPKQQQQQQQQPVAARRRSPAPVLSLSPAHAPVASAAAHPVRSPLRSAQVSAVQDRKTGRHLSRTRSFPNRESDAMGEGGSSS